MCVTYQSGCGETASVNNDGTLLCSPRSEIKNEQHYPQASLHGRHKYQKRPTVEVKRMRGTTKQINLALSIRKNRIAVWSKSDKFTELESTITAISDAGWWIANREKPFKWIYKKFKGEAVARADMETWTRIDTGTGIRWISPTRNMLTGEIVPDDGTVPF